MPSRSRTNHPASAYQSADAHGLPHKPLQVRHSDARTPRQFSAAPASEVDCADLARSLGLGDGLGHSAPLSRSLARMVAFKAAARPSEGVLAVRLALPDACLRQLARLSRSAKLGPPTLGPWHMATGCHGRAVWPGAGSAGAGEVSGATYHEVAWVAAAISQAAADLGVELPAAYALAVAAQGLRRGEGVGVTRLGPGVVLSSLPSDEHPMPFVVGYAEAGCQWYRDGRCHRPGAGTSPAGETPMREPEALAL